jgi:ribonuclease-3
MFFFRHIRSLFGGKKNTYIALKKILGFFPNDIRLYEEALLHKSSVKAHSKHINNERLEFLGDGIINAVVADIVYKRFKRRSEGFLTNMRAKIVRREYMDRISCELGLDKLIVSASKVSTQKNHVMGNALEAFIGAIYLDRGYREAYRFVCEKIVKKHIDIEALARKEINFKSRLLEWCQKHQITPEFQVTESFVDEEYNPVFQSQVFLNGIPAGDGAGYTKKASHQQAARKALRKIKEAAGKDDPLNFEK